MSEFAFAANQTAVTITLFVLAGFLVLAWLTWHRSEYSRRTLLVEILRITLVVMACLTILQPEMRTTVTPDTKQTIAVLIDGSKSMQTADVTITDDEGKPSAITRAEFVEQRINEELWNELGENSSVIVESFAQPDESSPEAANTSGTDINAAITNALERNENLRAVVMLGDGDWNTGGNPIQAAAEMLVRGVPFFGVRVGSDQRLPDLEITSASAPAFGIVGDKMQISFSIRSSMTEAVEVVVTLAEKGGRPVSKTISLPALRETSESLFWTPTSESETTLTLEVPVQPGELITENNTRKLKVSARKESIKVLVIDSLPRWEYRFIRNALYRDPGVTVNSLLLNSHKSVKVGGPGYLKEFPNDLKDLSTYDVIFLGDVGVKEGQLTESQAELLKQLVEQQASGLVFIPGRLGNQNSLIDSPLGPLLPVVLDKAKPRGTSAGDPSSVALTSTGKQNLLTILTRDEKANPNVCKNLPGFYWYAPILKAKAGTDVLAVHGTIKNALGRIPLLVTTTAGTGKVLYLGIDSAWRWRRGVEDLYHYRFWGQVARWMSYQRKMAEGERLRFFLNPATPQPGTTLTLNANAYDEFGVPLKDGTVTVDVTNPQGEIRRIDMAPSDGGFGAFFSSFDVTLPGEYTFVAKSSASSESVTTKVLVQGQSLEKIGQPARGDVFEELASITQGSVTSTADLPSLIESLANLRPRSPIVKSQPLQFTWWWLLTFTAIASAFWIARKWDGKI